MDGVSRWAVLGDKPSGCGARWDVRLQIGAAPVGGVVEVVEFEEPGDLAWNSVTGVTMRGRWRLRERVPGQTDVVLRLAYQAPGGLMGLLVDRVAAPMVRRSLKRSLRNLQMLVESRPAPSKVEGGRRSSGSSSGGRRAVAPRTTGSPRKRRRGRQPSPRPLRRRRRRPAVPGARASAPRRPAEPTRPGSTRPDSTRPHLREPRMCLQSLSLWAEATRIRLQERRDRPEPARDDVPAASAARVVRTTGATDADAATPRRRSPASSEEQERLTPTR